MLGFGIAGYVLRKLQYEFSPFLIAFVLAPMLEQSLRQSMVMSPDGLLIFMTRPVAATMIFLSCVLALLVLRQRKLIQPGGDL
jgi:putative tricarboxylic transport membrane protein